MKKLLGISEQDSLEKGYRFSPNKCVILSTDRNTQSLNGIELKQARLRLGYFNNPIIAGKLLNLLLVSSF